MVRFTFGTRDKYLFNSRLDGAFLVGVATAYHARAFRGEIVDDENWKIMLI